MRKISIVLFLTLFSFLASAEQNVYDSFHWGPRFEKGREFEGVGLDFITKPLYSFNNGGGAEMHHALIIGANLLTVSNVAVNSSGEYKSVLAFDLTAGLRAYNSNNSMYGDVAISYIDPDDDISKDASVGGLFRAGYLFPYSSRDQKDQLNMLDISLSYRIGFEKAEALPSKPDVFNGLGLAIAFLF